MQAPQGISLGSSRSGHPFKSSAKSPNAALTAVLSAVVPSTRALAALKNAVALNNVHAMYALGMYYAVAKETATALSSAHNVAAPATAPPPSTAAAATATPTPRTTTTATTTTAEIESLWTTAAIAGHASAQRELGLFYTAASSSSPPCTDGVLPSAASAAAATAASGTSNGLMALDSLSGMAIALLDAAAEQGDTVALSNAGCSALAAGDYAKATAYLSKAALNGDVQACCEFGWMLMNGKATDTWREACDFVAASRLPTGVRNRARPRVVNGMKLEARDRANKSLICVATIAEVKWPAAAAAATGSTSGSTSSSRKGPAATATTAMPFTATTAAALARPTVKIHFDGWGRNYDYTTTLGNEDLFYVGYCADNGKKLELPRRTYDADEILWDRSGPSSTMSALHKWGKYLKDSKASAIPKEWADGSVRKEAAAAAAWETYLRGLFGVLRKGSTSDLIQISRWTSPWLVELQDKANEILHQTLRKEGIVFADGLATATTAPTTTVTTTAPSTMQEAGAASTNSPAESGKDDAADGDSTTAVTGDAAADADAAAAVATPMHGADPFGAAEWFFERAAAELSPDAAFALATLKRVREASGDAADAIAAANAGTRYSKDAQSCAKYVARDTQIIPAKPEDQFVGKAATASERWEVLRNAGSAGCSDADFELSKEMFAAYNRDVTFMHATAFERGERDGISVKEWCAARLEALDNPRTNPTEEATPRTSYWLYSKVIDRAAVLAEQVAADESAVTCSLGGARKVNTRDSARQGHAHFLAGQLRQEQGNTKTALEHFKAASLANVPGATVAVGKCLLNNQNVARKHIPNGDEDDDRFDVCKDDEGFEAQSSLPALGQTPLTAVANPYTWFKKEADAGNPEAMVLLGNCHLTGTGVATKDPECAVALYQRAVELNCGAGMNALGKCFQDGVGVAADPTKARALFAAASASGSAPVSASSTATANKAPPMDANATLDGNCNLALCFVNGIGGPCNHAYGVRLLTEAAQKGSARAHAHLGMICTHKSRSSLLSPSTTPPTARWLFRKAADANDPLGLYKYGMLLVRPHLQQSSFTTVATSSQPPSCCGASGFHFHKISGECKQLHCGTALLLQAAQSGITEAYSHAANGLRAMAGSDSRTLSKGYAKAALIAYLRGDALGDASSQYSLAEYYLSISEGDRALHFAGRASDNGFAAATVLLGTICDTQGQHAAAANHFKAAANAGNLEGIHALAWCFKLGRGVQQDNGKAASLFRSASTKGHLPSRFESWVSCQQGHHGGGGSTNGVGCSSSSSSMVRRGSASNGTAFELSGRIADPTFVAFLYACKQGTMDSNSDALAQWPIKEERMLLVAQYYTDASAATYTAAFGTSRGNRVGSSNVGETLVAMHTAVEPLTGGTGSALAASNGHLASLQTVLAHRLSHVLPALARDRKFNVANVITDFNFGITLQDRHGKMMIQRAAKHRHWNCVRWLMGEGALAGFGTWSYLPPSSSGSGASAAAPAAVSTSMDGSQEIILDAFDEFATLVAEGGPADVETDVLVRRATLLAASAADVRMDLEHTSSPHADDGGSDASPAVFAGFAIMNAVGRMMRIADGKPCVADVRRTFWTSGSKELLVLLLQRLEADGLFYDSSQTHKRNWRCRCYGCPGGEQTLRNSSTNVLTLTMLTFLAGPAHALAHLLKHTTPSDDVVPAGLVRTMVETMSQFLNSSTVHMYANAEPKRPEPRSPAEKAQRKVGHHVKPFVCFPGKSGMMSSPGGFSSEDAHLFNGDLLSTLSVRDAANAAMDVLQASSVWVSTQHHTEAADTCLLNAANEIASSLHATITESKSANAAFMEPFPASIALQTDLAGKETQLTFEAAMVHDLQTALAVEILSERHASAYSMADILTAVVDVTGGRGSDESGGGARGGGDSNGSNRSPRIIAAADIAAAAEAKLLKACGADTLWSKPFGILESLLSKVDAVKRFGSNDNTEPLKKKLADLLARVTGAANMARAKRKAFRKSLQNARGGRTPSIATSTSTGASSAPAITAARSKKKGKGKRKAGASNGGDTRAEKPDSAGGGEAAVGGGSALETMAVVPEQDEPEPALSAAERLENALQSVSEFEVEALRVEQLCTLLDKYPALDQIGKCGICGDRETKTDALTNVAGKNIGGEHFKNKPCGCRYCKTCLSSWIKAKLDDRHICIACPSRGLESNGCQYMLYAADIKRLGTEHDFSRYSTECALFPSLFLSVDSFETLPS